MSEVIKRYNLYLDRGIKENNKEGRFVLYDDYSALLATIAEKDTYRDIEDSLFNKMAELARCPHYYSCPMSGDCCNDDLPKDECTCGADGHNKKVEELLPLWSNR